MSIGICYTHKFACIDDEWIPTGDMSPDDYVKKKKIKGATSIKSCPNCKNNHVSDGSDSSRKYQELALQQVQG